MSNTIKAIHTDSVEVRLEETYDGKFQVYYREVDEEYFSNPLEDLNTALMVFDSITFGESVWRKLHD